MTDSRPTQRVTEQNRDGLTLLPAVETDFEDVLALNRAFEVETSPLTAAKLQSLHAQACYHKVASVGGTTKAFLIAFRQDAHYENANFQWFAQRYTHFIYIDRIVVAADTAGMGLGTALYHNLFKYASECQVPVITCEYNLSPPNLRSKRFHDRLGFQEVGQRRLQCGEKLVSMQVKTL